MTARPMSLLELYESSLIGRRDVPAVEYDRGDGTTGSFTFGEIDARSNRLALLLAAHGLSRGDRLGFYLVNRIEIVDLWIACVKLGVIVVPINVLYKAREIAHIVADAEPAAIVTTEAQRAEFPAGIACWDICLLYTSPSPRDRQKYRMPS